MTALAVTLDILHEAASRRWLLALLSILTAVAAVLALSLQMDVVDGALAGTRLFGEELGDRVRTVNGALKPVLLAGAYGVFYGGLAVGVLACSDFAPELLTPGRIEHLLALPVRRVELLLGTYLGVLAIAGVCALYATGLFTVLLGSKSGLWSPVLMLAGAFGWCAFAAVYAVMLATSVFVRSAALSAAVGSAFVLAASILTTPGMAALFERGLDRNVWLACTGWLPHLWILGEAAPGLAGLHDGRAVLLPTMLGAAVFALAVLALAMWQLERKDF